MDKGVVIDDLNNSMKECGNLRWIVEAYANLSVCMAEIDSLVGTTFKDMGIDSNTLSRVRLMCDEREAFRSSAMSAIAAINYAITQPMSGDFLRCWVNNEFEVLRREYPDAPEHVFGCLINKTL